MTKSRTLATVTMIGLLSLVHGLANADTLLVPEDYATI